MSLPPALDPALTAGLQPEPVPAPAPPQPVLRHQAGRAAGRALRAGKAKVRPLAVRFVAAETAGVREQADTATARLDEVEDRLAALHEAQTAAALQRAAEQSARDLQRTQEQEAYALQRAQGQESRDLLHTQVQAATINLELLKAEVRDTKAVLERLGMAIAPATGIDGAEVRMAELRERVNGLDRRLRTLTDRLSAGAPVPAPTEHPTEYPAEHPTEHPTALDPRPAAGPVAGDNEKVTSALFDYVGFERRFRGDPQEVLRTLDERYGALLEANAPVLDVGCGRAELLLMLRERGVPALGVDTDPSMVAEAQAQGLEVHEVDAVSYLRSIQPGSLGSIIATHVVEHLALDELIELLELAATRLRPGGVLIAETPNPQSLIVLGNSYLLDPTHVRPLHPSLLAFLCEGAGFRGVELRFFAPATGYHLPLVDDPEAPAWAETVNQGFRQLNEVLFGAQDFAVVATAAPQAEE